MSTPFTIKCIICAWFDGVNTNENGCGLSQILYWWECSIQTRHAYTYTKFIQDIYKMSASLYTNYLRRPLMSWEIITKPIKTNDYINKSGEKIGFWVVVSKETMANTHIIFVYIPAHIASVEHTHTNTHVVDSLLISALFLSLPSSRYLPPYICSHTLFSMTFSIQISECKNHFRLCVCICVHAHPCVCVYLSILHLPFIMPIE